MTLICVRKNQSTFLRQKTGPGDREEMLTSSSEPRGRQDRRRLRSVSLPQPQAPVLPTAWGPGAPGEDRRQGGQERQQASLGLSTDGGFLSLHAFSANFQFFFNERIIL